MLTSFKTLSLLCLLSACSHMAVAASWLPNTETDKMSGQATRSVSLKSENSLDFDFPYKGINYGYLYVIQRPAKPLFAVVEIDKGQMICGYGDCSVRIKFDAEKPAVWSASKSGDGSSTYLVIDDTKRFVAKAKKAKSILVQFTAYKAGDQVLEFAPKAPLVWPIGK